MGFRGVAYIEGGYSTNRQDKARQRYFSLRLVSVAICVKGRNIAGLVWDDPIPMTSSALTM